MLYPVLLAAVCAVLEGVQGHGRLVEPPSRSSMWRYGYDTPEDWADNQQFCGGFTHQWEKHGGKCGICGDPWDGERTHEAGGKFANEVIVRRYQPGHVILVIVQLTAAHLGYFEFRICPNNNPKKRVVQHCLDRRVLELADDSGSRFYITNSTPQNYEILLKLPEDLFCSQCVFQWKYHTGNSWGQEGNEPGCLGCGSQEEFYGCADVAIGNNTLFDPLYYEMLQLEIQQNLTRAATGSKDGGDDPAPPPSVPAPTAGWAPSSLRPGADMVTLSPAQQRVIDLGPHIPPQGSPHQPGSVPRASDLAGVVQLPTDDERDDDEGWVMDFLNDMWGVMFDTIQTNLRSLGGVFANATIPKPPKFQSQFPDFFLDEQDKAQQSAEPVDASQFEVHRTTDSPALGIPPAYLKGNIVGVVSKESVLSRTAGPGTGRKVRKRKLRLKNPTLKFRQQKEEKKLPKTLSWTDELTRALNPDRATKVTTAPDEKSFLGMGTTHASIGARAGGK